MNHLARFQLLFALACLVGCTPLKQGVVPGQGPATTRNDAGAGAGDAPDSGGEIDPDAEVPGGGATDAAAVDTGPPPPCPGTTPSNYADACGSCGGIITCSGACSKTDPAGLGQPCGMCAGTIQCDGKCSKATPPSFGQACGKCGGVTQCDGSCSKTDPAGLGQACGACGGTTQCDGSCSNGMTKGEPCGGGKCGGTKQCDGSCSKTDPANLGAACGHCGGTFQCDTSCSKPDPAGYGQACGKCGGTIQCDGTCSKSTPPNLGQACGKCGGTIQCDGACSKPTPANFGQPCSVCGNFQCDGTCTKVTQPCKTACGGGSETCENNHWVACTAPKPTPEICDDADNDCNGAIDDGFRAQSLSTSYTALRALHPGCDGAGQRMGPACNAAINRFCANRGCTHTGFGPLENSGDAAGVACVTRVMSLDVPFTTLLTFHPGCNTMATYGPACNAAIHRFCAAKPGFVSGFGPNETGPASAAVACVPAEIGTVVSTTYTALAMLHPGCNGTSERMGPACNAAINRFCAARGDVTGFGPVENSADVAVITCLKK